MAAELETGSRSPPYEIWIPAATANSLQRQACGRTVDLVEEQFDVAIRINSSTDSSLVGRCFAKDRLVVVAAPGVPVPEPGAVRQVPAIVATTFQTTTWNLDDGRLILEPLPRLK